MTSELAGTDVAKFSFVITCLQAYVDEAQLARSYAQTMGQVPLPPSTLMRVASEQIAPTASMPQLPHAHSQPAGACSSAGHWQICGW